METLRSIIGGNIKQLRKSAGYSQSYVGNKIDVSQSTVGRIEDGKTDYGIDKVETASKLFNIDAWRLLVKDLGDGMQVKAARSTLGEYQSDIYDSNHSSNMHDSALTSIFSPDTVQVIKQLDKPGIEMLESLIKNFSKCDQQGKEHLAFSGETAKSGSEFRENAKKAENKKKILKGLDSEHAEAKPTGK